ncbi:MAG: phosphatase PAP2 family protein [Flavobacteriales bacterium]|nr:phosphatase PAP2 family protein [Flavobacteriales bacterium]
MKKFTPQLKFSFLFLILLFQTSFAQQDSLKESVRISEVKLNVKQYIIPAAFITYGFISLENPKLNNTTAAEIQEDHPNFQYKIDNYSQFAPGVAVFALNAFGVKGKHNWKDAALIYGTSIAIASAFVLPLKKITKETRPDSSANNSFPSGHTAIAFASAEFLRQEYKDDPWIGYAGYAVATATGLLRMYNNKHYLGDVFAGAGFGIASAKFSYFLYDKVFLKKGWHFTITPVYINKTVGFAYNYNF